MLDIGTTYTNSRIIYNAEVGGYTGYAESKAANSYDMFLNLSTTRTDGGWVYFRISNDDYIQLPGSGNKVNIYKDTSTSGHLDVVPFQATTSIKAYVNHAEHQGNVKIEARWNSQGYVHFDTTNADGLLFLATKDDIYLCCGLNIIVSQTNNKCFR